MLDDELNGHHDSACGERHEKSQVPLPLRQDDELDDLVLDAVLSGLADRRGLDSERTHGADDQEDAEKAHGIVDDQCGCWPAAQQVVH